MDPLPESYVTGLTVNTPPNRFTTGCYRTVLCNHNRIVFDETSYLTSWISLDADNISNQIYLNKYVWISIMMILNFQNIL